MANSKRSSASYVAEERNKTGKNPFKGLTMSAMKSKWSKMTPEQRSKNVQNFRNAAKSAPKAAPKKKPVAKAKPVTKTKPKPPASKKKDLTISQRSQQTTDNMLTDYNRTRPKPRVKQLKTIY